VPAEGQQAYGGKLGAPRDGNGPSSSSAVVGISELQPQLCDVARPGCKGCGLFVTSLTCLPREAVSTAPNPPQGDTHLPRGQQLQV
jgi:hypothetical protein